MPLDHDGSWLSMEISKYKPISCAPLGGDPPQPNGNCCPQLQPQEIVNIF
jgi:hypothetical protein